MSWRFTGHARVNSRSPQAFGVCDRCGMWYNLVNLHYQYEWRGPRLANIRLRVCPRCLDIPFIFNRPLIIPPDPIPVWDPRPQNFIAADEGTDPLPPLPWPVQPLAQAPPPTPGGPSVPPDFILPEVEPYTQPPPPLPYAFVPPELYPESDP